MLLFILGVVVIVVGLAGLVLPGLPGTPLVFAGSLLVAWADGFERVGWFALLLIGMLALVSAIADYGASVFGAKKAGASAWGVVGAFLGLVVGLPFGIPGIVLGPIVGATVLILQEPAGEAGSPGGRRRRHRPGGGGGREVRLRVRDDRGARGQLSFLTTVGTGDRSRMFGGRAKGQRGATPPSLDSRFRGNDPTAAPPRPRPPYLAAGPVPGP